MPTIQLETAHDRYSITIADGLLGTLASRLRALGLPRTARVVVITSPEIARLWSATVLSSFSPESAPTILLLPPGEQHKRLGTIERLAGELASAHAGRDTVLLALGGGVIGDVTGFLAAIYMRGIPYIQLPTTLLAQVDSAVGGKTGVNLAQGKNLVGSFHQPLAVFADTATLRTLPLRELRAGMQEAVKAGLLGDARLFRLIETHGPTLLDPANLATLTRVVAASVRVKAAIVAADERESGSRMLLNLGHTLGHAIETATRYRVLLHGEAVAWGMIAAVHLANARGVLTASTADSIEHVILAFGPLPRFRATAEQLVALAASDKKVRAGILSFVLPVAVGKAVIVRDVSESELLTAARSMLCRMRAHTADQTLAPTLDARRGIHP